MIASLLSVTVSRNPKTDAVDSTLIFSIAIAVAALVITLQKDCIFVCEIWIVEAIYFGAMILQSRKSSLPGWRTWVKLSTDLAMLSFSIWFSFRGENSHFVATPCGTSFFLFSHVVGRHLHQAFVFLGYTSIFVILLYALWVSAGATCGMIGQWTCMDSSTDM